MYIMSTHLNTNAMRKVEVALRKTELNKMADFRKAKIISL